MIVLARLQSVGYSSERMSVVIVSLLLSEFLLLSHYHSIAKMTSKGAVLFVLASHDKHPVRASNAALLALLT